MKRISRILIVLLLSLSFFSTTIARAATLKAPSDYGQPIETNTYQEENGCVVTEKIYFVPDNGDKGIATYSKSGNGWYKNEKTYEWSGGTKMKYYAQGYFTWGNGTVKVTKSSGGVNNVPKKVKITKKKTKVKYGKYGWVFNDYAKVTFSFTATNQIGLSTDFSVAIRVSQSGNAI